MKPTQQEIIELAREAGYPDAILEFAPAAIERLVHLALERFGAGGGEPVAFMVETEVGVMVWPAKDHDEALTYCAQGDLPTKLYAHPSPLDLQAEYLRGLEDAAEWVEKQHTWITSAAASAGIRALKGKQ